MKKSQALQIAIVGSLVLSVSNVNPGSANAAARRTTPTVATRSTTTVARRSTTTASSAKKTAATTVAGGSGAASLVVSGFFSGTLSEVRLTTPRCHPRGAAADAGFEFDGPNSRHVLTFYLPNGTTKFPSTDPHQYFVSLVDLSDPSKLWTIGGRNQSSTAGTATFDGAQGTVDVEMTPSPPNPKLTPIHLKGSFSCAYGPP